MKLKKSVSILGAIVVLSGCGREGVQAKSVALAVADQPNCPSGQDRLWAELYRQVDENGGLPATDEVEAGLKGLTRTSAQREALVRAYSSIAHEIRFLDREEALARLAEMEIGDRTTEDKFARQEEVEGNLGKALAASEAALGGCPAPTPAPPENPADPVTSVPPPGSPFPDRVPMFEDWRKSMPASVYGAYKSISIGYQSCNAVDLAPLTVSTGWLEGITVVGRHPNGIGRLQEVTNPAAVFRTSPYYANRRAPASGCFQAAKTPLIYDYGGKPYATTSSGGTLDFFRNAGSGSSALGIDCSGFVASSVLTGGLRLKRNVTSKAPQVAGVNAAMFADPAKNGLSCFSRVASTTSQTLKPGDILSNTGHIVMVDRVSADPFGLASAKTGADCEKASVSKFNFTIIQSSASKGGVGMNRYRASDYFGGYSAMRLALVAYAKSFCRVRLGLEAPRTLANVSQGVLIRNEGGAGCTNTPIPIVGQECLSTCSSATLP